MGLRPARCYRCQKKRLRNAGSGHARKTGKQRAYTRIAINVPDRNYIGAAPQLKTRQFNMGNPLLKYDTVADLIAKESLDIRDNAIESVRATINRKLVKDLGKDAYFMKVRIYPSHLMRENKQAQGAGADRVSQGMTLAFGIPIGRAARVRAGQVIFSILCMDEQKEIVKTALHRANAKFPCKVEVKFHTDIKSLGTLPSKAIEEKIVEVAKPGAEAATTGTEAVTTGTETTKGTTGTETGKTPAASAKGAPAAKGTTTPTTGKEAKTETKPAGKKK
jgi:large subunit ribosomal protein L10e